MTPSNRRWLLPLSILIVAALLWGLRDHLAPSELLDQPTGAVSSPEKSAGAFLGDPDSLAILAAGAEALPESLAFVADGLVLDVSHSLAARSRLQVTSPTSARFLDASLPDKVIAERLRARNLLRLEVSVNENVLNLHARLTDARRGVTRLEQNWTFEQGSWNHSNPSLVSAITATLESSASPLPTAAVNDEAWLAYLSGLQKLASGQAQLLAQAAEDFGKAMFEAPGFAAAKLEAVRVHLALASNEELDDVVMRAETILESLIEQDAEDAESWAFLAFVRHQYQWDFTGAAAAARRAAFLRPGRVDALAFTANALLTVEKYRQASEMYEQASKLDPLNLFRRIRLGQVQEASGEWDAALSTYRQAIILNPDIPAAYALRARIKILQDKPGVAVEEAEQETHEFWKAYALALTERAGDGESDTPRLEQFTENYADVAAYRIAEIRSWRKQTDQAFIWLRRALDQRDGGLRDLAGNAFFRPLHGDPRWTALLTDLGLQDTKSDAALLDSNPAKN